MAFNNSHLILKGGLKISKQKKNMFFYIAVIFIGFYPVLYISSHLIYYLYDSDILYIHDKVLIEGIDLNIWTNSASSNCNTSRTFPLFKNCNEKGPFIIGVRAIDKDNIATRFYIHSASINNSNKQSTDLIFANSSSQNGWIPFEENASEWIVHAVNEKEVQLGDMVQVYIDFSLEKNGAITRNVTNLTLSKTIQVTKGWVFLTSWVKANKETAQQLP